MRAGLLSDPRIVHLLRTVFVPVRLTARNTRELLVDPRDGALLDAIAAATGRGLMGGERELFLLPDGTPGDVFLSLDGGGAKDASCEGHRTADGRRNDAALRPFRRHAESAFRALDRALPDDWEQVWNGQHENLQDLLASAPVWPTPPAGEQALRIFVRNSYRLYDDLHGCELVPVTAAQTTALRSGLAAGGDRALLPAELRDTLLRAMVPRGQVGTQLGPESISGEFALVVEEAANGSVRGRVEGTFALRPSKLEEVARRLNAACMFAAEGAFCGTFSWPADAAAPTLRAVATDVAFEWQPRGGHDGSGFAPFLRVSVEWIGSGP